MLAKFQLLVEKRSPAAWETNWKSSTILFSHYGDHGYLSLCCHRYSQQCCACLDEGGPRGEKNILIWIRSWQLNGQKASQMAWANAVRKWNRNLRSAHESQKGNFDLYNVLWHIFLASRKTFHLTELENNWKILSSLFAGLAHVNSTYPSTNGSLTHYLPATQAHRMHYFCHNSNSSKAISQK